MARKSPENRLRPENPAVPVLIGPFPEPLHGMSAVNAKLADILRARGVSFAIIDLSPGRWGRGLAYHATRLVRVGQGVLRILTAPRSPQRRYIMSLDAGGGLLYNIALALAARLTGQAMIFYHHSTRYLLADSKAVRLLLRVAGAGVPHVFCSEKMAALFRTRYNAQGAVIIVNNAAWVEPPPESVMRRTGKLRLGFLSNLMMEKGYRRAIDTLGAVRGRGIEAELIMAGAAVDDDALRIVAQAERAFGSDFSYQGVVHGPDKAAFYAGLDVFLFPSLYRHETQSLVVPEALAAGIPVIAYDHRFVGDILGEGGLLVPATEVFAEYAAEWIAGGQDTGMRAQRQSKARLQFERERKAAAGQVDRLVDWARGSAP